MSLTYANLQNLAGHLKTAPNEHCLALALDLWESSDFRECLALIETRTTVPVRDYLMTVGAVHFILNDGCAELTFNELAQLRTHADSLELETEFWRMQSNSKNLYELWLD